MLSLTSRHFLWEFFESSFFIPAWNLIDVQNLSKTLWVVVVCHLYNGLPGHVISWLGLQVRSSPEWLTSEVSGVPDLYIPRASWIQDVYSSWKVRSDGGCTFRYIGSVASAPYQTWHISHIYVRSELRGNPLPINSALGLTATPSDFFAQLPRTRTRLQG